jgi:WD40 repeat protein
MAAAFFDPEAKRAVVHEVRDAIRQAAQRSGREPAEVEDPVFATIMAEAARRARPPRRDEPPEPRKPLLSGDDLDRMVLGSYPAPIARPYRALLSEDSSAGGFGCLLDVFESLVHFLATVAVSAYHRSGLDLADCNRQLVERFVKRVWSTGDLFGLLRDTIALAGDCAGFLPYAELPRYLFTARGKPTASCTILEGFIAVRNRVWGHGAGRSSVAFASILPEHRELLEGELAWMSWLADWPLVRPVRIDEDEARIVRWVPLMGESPRREQVEPIALDPRDLDPEAGLIRGEKSLLLLAPDRSRYLPLFPLSLFSVSSEQGKPKQGVYLLQRCQWEHIDRRRYLKEASYVAYDAGLNDHSEHSERGGDATARRLEQFLERLEAKVPRSIGPPEDLSTFPTTPTDDPDFTLPQVRAEQEGHLRSFVGREHLLQEVAHWIDGKSEGGYLLLLGPPGQGKSALMAQLSRREEQPERGGCLLHMVKSHNNPLRFLPALISQAARLAKIRFGEEAYRGDVRDLRNTLVRAVEAVRDGPGHGRALVVIDALDELAEGADRLEFLPQVLPAGVRVVLTCRPDIPLVEALRVRLVGQLEEREVPPLVLADFRLMLERRLEDRNQSNLESQIDFGLLFDRLEGNPLFLRLAMDRIVAEVADATRQERAARIDVNQLPQTLDAWFRDIYLRIGKRPTSQGWKWTRQGRQRIELLKLLCVAREAIGYDELSGQMAAASRPMSLEDCRDRIAEMSQYLLDAGDNRFKPWHQGLADHVIRRELGPSGLSAVEETFCRWLRESGLGRYALRHRVDHLLAAGQPDEVARLLTDPVYLESKAEAGLIFDLIREFGRCRERLPASTHPTDQRIALLEQALRDEANFLARHPTALFQCLWNRCWWYDAHDPGRGSQDGRMSTLLEAWREEKERRSPGFVWLRSLRPPPVALGGAQQAVFRGHEGWIWCVACSADGQRIASASYDRTVRVWDATTSAELLCLRGHQAQVLGVAFSPDGRRIASGSDDRTVRIWDATTGAELLCLRGHSNAIRSVAFSIDSRKVVSASHDWTVRIWNADNGAELCRLRGHEGQVRSIAISPDGRWIASGSKDRTLRLWDLDSGCESTCLCGHEGSVASVAWSLDSRRIASGSDDKTVRVWDAATDAELLCLRGHEGPVWSVTFADGSRLVSGSDDKTVRIWDIATGAKVASLRGHQGAVRSVAFDPHNRRVISGSWDKVLCAWDLSMGTVSMDSGGHRGRISDLASNPSGSRLVSGSDDGTLSVWDTTTGVELLCLRRHEKAVTAVAFSPDSRKIASGSDDKTVRVWDLDAGVESNCFLGHQEAVWGVAWSRDGRRLASGSDDKTLRVWDLCTGQEVACLRGHGDRVTSVAFSPDGRRLASGSDDRTVRLFDIESGAELLRLSGHESFVLYVGFARDGSRIASACNRTVRVWDATDGACLEVIPGAGDVEAIATGSHTCPWRALRRGLETVIAPMTDGGAIAWFSVALSGLVTHPSGRLWAGGFGSHVYLIQLEGQP